MNKLNTTVESSIMDHILYLKRETKWAQTILYYKFKYVQLDWRIQLTGKYWKLT
jgi:hypothetical protein